MVTNMNRLIALALMPHTPPSVKLDSSRIEVATDAERELAKIIGEETEREREARRAQHGKVPQGLLGDEVDYVDTLQWDEFLQDISVLEECGKRAMQSPRDVLAFAMAKCSPLNWRALFWMQAWYDQINRSVTADVGRVAAELTELYEQKHAAAARQRAKAAADARHGKPGGNRDKRAAIREIWASGKHGSREQCAEQEYSALGFNTLGTALRALRNTPNPDHWPGNARHSASRRRS